jgi:hypothetical protein
MGIPLKLQEDIRRPRVDKLRAQIKWSDKHVERGPLGTLGPSLVIWGVLKVRSALNLFWEWNDFGYDPIL